MESLNFKSIWKVISFERRFQSVLANVYYDQNIMVFMILKKKSNWLQWLSTGNSVDCVKIVGSKPMQLPAVISHIFSNNGILG